MKKVRKRFRNVNSGTILIEHVVNQNVSLLYELLEKLDTFLGSFLVVGVLLPDREDFPFRFLFPLLLDGDGEANLK